MSEACPERGRRVEVVLYTRPDCHLCHDARDVLERARRRLPFVLVEKNVDDSPEVASLYGLEIPVVLIGGRKAFKYRVDPAKLERLLERAASND